MTTNSGFTRTALEVAEANGDQSGKVFLITGAYSGIGVETTKALLKINAQVILAGRNAQTMNIFVEGLAKAGYDAALIDAAGPLCDLTDLNTVNEFAAYVKKRYTKVDVVLLNAGVMMTPVGVTKQGYEIQVGTNVLGHFLLANTLLPITSRQVWVSSKAYEMSGGKNFDFNWFQNFRAETEEEKKAYDSMFAYQQSKLGNILLAKEFAKRDERNAAVKLEAVSLHPGIIDTNLSRHLGSATKGIFTVLGWVGILSKKTVEQGAATSVTCATAVSVTNGAYYDDCEPARFEHGNATNEADAIRLFDLCVELTKDFM